MSDKASLRRELLSVRLKLTDSEYRSANMHAQAALRSLLSHTSYGFNSIHTYRPLLPQREVVITPVISWLAELHPRKIVHTTRKTAAGWVTADWNTGKLVTPLISYDLIIIPMLGFDERLHRIGYGGGFYDRFLSLQPTAYKVGLCFEIGHILRLPNEAYDISLDSIATDQTTYGLIG
jgi:5,10-methenyltetrahydrofolate synthetase